MTPEPVTMLYVSQQLGAGIREVPGPESHPLILYALQRVAPWAGDDAVPWCGAWQALVAHITGCPEPELAARARSWLTVGRPIPLEEARPGWDVVIFSRGHNAPGPEVLKAPGHVSNFVDRGGGYLAVHGGNQHDGVNLSYYPASRVLGVRRLREAA